MRASRLSFCFASAGCLCGLLPFDRSRQSVRIHCVVDTVAAAPTGVANESFSTVATHWKLTAVAGTSGSALSALLERGTGVKNPLAVLQPSIASRLAGHASKIQFAPMEVLGSPQIGPPLDFSASAPDFCLPQKPPLLVLLVVRWLYRQSVRVRCVVDSVADETTGIPYESCSTMAAHWASTAMTGTSGSAEPARLERDDVVKN